MTRTPELSGRPRALPIHQFYSVNFVYYYRSGLQELGEIRER